MREVMVAKVIRPGIAITQAGTTPWSNETGSAN